jgi:hypothetical protein
MAVALKEIAKEGKKGNLKLAPKQEVKKIQYEFPYDDMYLLYDCILKEMKTKK